VQARRRGKQSLYFELLRNRRICERRNHRAIQFVDDHSACAARGE